jgi:hypothetical protein
LTKFVVPENIVLAVKVVASKNDDCFFVVPTGMGLATLAALRAHCICQTSGC